MRLSTLVLTVGVLAGRVCIAQTTYYVNGDCGNNDWSGLSPLCEGPDGPKKTITYATAAAGPGDIVEVAPGVYPMETNRFAIGNPMTVRSSAGPLQTVIDGEYTYHKISVFNFDGGPAVIEGFTITRIDTHQFAPISLAFADLMLVNCRFIDNEGVHSGAVWMDDGINTLSLVDCTFQNNRGQGVGVARALYVEVAGCTFIGNAGLLSDISCVYADNDFDITNCIFRGEPPFFDYGEAGTASYSNIEGGYPGEGNIDADPMFVDAASGDLRLLPGSPCIDAGDNSGVPEWLRLDIGGLERFVDDPGTKDTGKGQAPIVDMGAHEFQVSCYPDFTGDGALDLFDFLAFVNLFNTADPKADCAADGVHDLFDFLCFVNAFNGGC